MDVESSPKTIYTKVQLIWAYVVTSGVLIVISAYFSESRGEALLEGLGAASQIGVAIALYFLTREQIDVARRQNIITQNFQDFTIERENEKKRELFEKKSIRFSVIKEMLPGKLLSFYNGDGDRKDLMGEICSQLDEVIHDHKPSALTFSSNLRYTMKLVMDSGGKKQDVENFKFSCFKLIDHLETRPLFPVKTGIST